MPRQGLGGSTIGLLVCGCGRAVFPRIRCRRGSWHRGAFSTDTMEPMMKKGMALFVCAVAMLWTGVADAAESLRFFTASPVAANDAASAGEKQVTRANVATLEPEVRSYLRAPAPGDPANTPKVDLQLFDDVRLTLRERSRTKSRGTTSTVEFAIEGDGGGRAVIVITDDVVFGSIHTGSHKNFRVMHRHDG